MIKLSRIAPWALMICFAAAAGLHLWRAWLNWGWRHAIASARAEHACRLARWDPACWRAAARLREQEGADALPLWLHSLDLDPRNAEAAVAAAMPLEAAARPAETERLLQRAAQWNQLWLPRWSLALFYARQGRRQEFWQWAGPAFERSYWDRTAMFRQCAAQGGTAEFLLQSVLPARLDLRLALVHYLTSQAVDDQLAQASLAAVACARPEQRDETVPTIVEAIGAMARAGRPEEAFSVWTGLCRSRLIGYTAPSLEAPVTNPKLRAPFLGTGFDWQVPPVSGVSSLPLTGGAGVRFTLTGSQPTDTVLLEQWLFLRGGRRWSLRAETKTLGIDRADSGLYWRILDGETGFAYEKDQTPAASEEWTQMRRSYQGPPGDRLVRLALVAARRPGRIRMQGDVMLRRVELTMEQAATQELPQP